MNTRALSVVLSLVFLVSGGAKLAGLEFEIVAFERWGYPQWCMYFIGAIEVAGDSSLLVGRFSVLASAWLAAMMIGAIATHGVHAEWGMLVAAAVILTLSAVRAVIGRSDIIALASRKHQLTIST